MIIRKKIFNVRDPIKTIYFTLREDKHGNDISGERKQ
jgi:hypothetical protein